MGETVAIPLGATTNPSDDFVGMYEVHSTRLVRALQLAGLGREEAEDVAQEAFARTLVHWRRVRNGENPPGYVYRVAFRLKRRQLRRDQPTADLEDVVTDIAAEASTRVGLEAVLRSMPARRRACATMCFVVGMSPVEAGRSLGIAPSTVRKQLAEARRALRPLVADG